MDSGAIDRQAADTPRPDDLVHVRELTAHVQRTLAQLPPSQRVAFELIRSYSPYDQVRPQAYPPMLVTAGLNDPRVTYWEPAKWVAKLRELKTDTNELLLKTNMGAGHGGKSGRFESLRETAEEFAFILWQLGVEN